MSRQQSDNVQHQQNNITSSNSKTTSSSIVGKLLPATCRAHRVTTSDSLDTRMPTHSRLNNNNNDSNKNNDCGYDSQLGRLHPASRFHNGSVDSFGGDVVCLKNGTTASTEESPLLNLHNFVHGTEQFFHAFSPAPPLASSSSIQNSSNNNNNNDGGVQQTLTGGSNNDDNNNSTKSNNSDVIDEVDGGRSSSSNNSSLTNNNNNSINAAVAANLQQQEKNSTITAVVTNVANNSSSTSSSSSSSSSSGAEFLELDGSGSGSAGSKKANKASSASFVLYPPTSQQTTQFTSLSPSNTSNNNNNATSNPRNVKLAGAASLASYRSHPYTTTATTSSSLSTPSNASGTQQQQQQNLFPYSSSNNNNNNNSNNNSTTTTDGGGGSSVSPAQNHHDQMNSAAAAAAAAAAISANGFFHPAYRDFEQLHQQQQQFVASTTPTPNNNWQASPAASSSQYNAAMTAAASNRPHPSSVLPSPSGVGPGSVGQVGPVSSNYPPSNVLPYLYLLNRDLWVKFNRHGNEMIVTKQGRRMFPSLIVKIAGLQPHAAYHLYVEVVQADPHQWKFTNGRWMANGIADIDPPEQPSPNAIYHHPESPCSGAEWMSRKIDFCSMKLTNDRTTTSGHIVLNSMRKYVPRIHVIEMPIGAGGILSPNQLMLGPNGIIDSKTPHWTFTFPETAFIAVTTYQNPVVTQLKIENNPFAKGFRDSDRDTRPVVTNSSSSSTTPAAPSTTDGTSSGANSHHHSHNHHHNSHHSNNTSSSSSNNNNQRHQARGNSPQNASATRTNTSSALSTGGGASSDSSSPLSASEMRLQQQGQVSAPTSYIRHAQTPSQVQQASDLLLTSSDHGGAGLFSATSHIGPLTPNTSRSMMASWSQCNADGWSTQAMLDAAGTIPAPPTAVQLAQLNQHTSLGIYSPISPASAAVGLFAPASSSPATVFNFGQNTPPGSGNNSGVIWPPSVPTTYSAGPTSNQFAILGPGINNNSSSSCALSAVMPQMTGSTIATGSMMQSVINAADPTSAFSHLAWADGGASFYQ